MYKTLMCVICLFTSSPTWYELMTPECMTLEFRDSDQQSVEISLAQFSAVAECITAKLFKHLDEHITEQAQITSVTCKTIVNRYKVSSNLVINTNNQEPKSFTTEYPLSHLKVLQIPPATSSSHSTLAVPSTLAKFVLNTTSNVSISPEFKAQILNETVPHFLRRYTKHIQQWLCCAIHIQNKDDNFYFETFLLAADPSGQVQYFVLPTLPIITISI